MTGIIPIILVLKQCVMNLVARSWPRVQSTHQKPHWIHVDFEHFEDEEDEEEEEKEEEVDPEKRERIVSGKILHTQHYTPPGLVPRPFFFK